MNNRCFLFAILCLCSFGALADAVDKTKFKAAYAAYNKCIETGDKECAANQAEIAYEEGKEIFPTEGKNMAALQYNYGLAVLNLGARSASEKSYGILQEALPLNKKHFGESSLQVLSLLVDLTRAQLDLPGKEKNTHRYWSQAIELSEELNGEHSLNHAYVLQDVSNILLLGHSYSKRKANRYAKTAYEIFQKELGPKHPSTSYMALNLGKYQLSISRFKAASEHFEEALIGFEQATEARNRYAMTTRGFLVEVYEEMGERDKATEYCLAIGAATPKTTAADYYPLIKKAPKYPSSAARTSTEGTVTLEYTVSEMGFVEDVEVLEWAGSRSFIKPSLKAVKTFRYAPQFIDGKPVKTKGVKNRFTFTMAKG